LDENIFFFRKVLRSLPKVALKFRNIFLIKKNIYNVAVNL
jgi:hypothetical protein